MSKTLAATKAPVPPAPVKSDVADGHNTPTPDPVAATPTPAAAAPAATALAATPPAGLTAFPEFDPADFNYDVDGEGVTVPRIRLLQPTRFDERFNGVDSGHFVNVATGEDLGTVLRVVVLGVQQSRARFADVKIGGDLLCRSADGASGQGDPGGPCRLCPFALWGKDHAAPECSLSYNYFVLPVGTEGAVAVDDFTTPAILRLARSSMAEAKRWNYQLVAYRPPFGVVYEVATVKTRAKKGAEYFAPRIRPLRRVGDHATLVQLAGLAQQVRDTARRVLASDTAHAAEREDAVVDDDPLFGPGPDAPAAAGGN